MYVCYAVKLYCSVRLDHLFSVLIVYCMHSLLFATIRDE